MCLHNADADTVERCYQTTLQYYGLAGDEPGAGIVLMNLGTIANDIHLDAAEAEYLLGQSLVNHSFMAQRVQVGERF